jgi:hypothetical protein
MHYTDSTSDIWISIIKFRLEDEGFPEQLIDAATTY